MEQIIRQASQQKSASENIEIGNLTKELLSSFPLERYEALFFAITGFMQASSATVTQPDVKKKLEEVLEPSELPPKEMLDELCQMAFQIHGTAIAPWIPYLWKKTAFNDVIFTEEGNPRFDESTIFFKSDSDAASVVRHAIASKSALNLVICEFIDEGSSQIAGRLLERDGIAVLYARKTMGDAEYIEAALQAHHLNGIVIFHNDVPESSGVFLEVVEKFGLRFGTVREYDDSKPKTKEMIDEMRNHPLIQQVPSVTYKPRPLYGEELCKEAGKYFNSNPEFLRLLASSKVNAATICSSRKLLNHMTEDEDWKGVQKYLSSAIKLDISTDMVKSRQVLSDSYDVDVLNTDTDPHLIVRMARKAIDKHQPFRFIACGGPGTGKTAFAHWLAGQLGKELLVKGVADIQKVFIGESEAAIRAVFSEAEEKDAIILLDECEAYLGKRMDSSSSGGKTYNSITNCFLTEIERFNGILICTTNRLDIVDGAFHRRLHRIVNFGFPTESSMRRLFSRYFPGIEFDANALDDICRSGCIGPGDFSILKELIEYMDEGEVTPGFILSSLEKTAERRGASTKPNRIIGFQ